MRGQGGTKRIRQGEVQQPIVILGVPGLGKTELSKALGSQPGLVKVQAGSFTRGAQPASPINEGTR